MILSANQRKTLERGLATLTGLEEKLAYLEQIAQNSPLYAERVKQLRDRHTYQKTLATVAITADSSSR